MRYARLAIAKVTVAAEAQSGKTVETFHAVIMLFAKASGIDPINLELDEVSAELIVALNAADSAVAVDDQVIVGQEVGGRWIRIATGGGGGGKIFVTPAGGIAKRDGIACSFAACVSWIINDSNNLVIEDPDADPIDVYNIFACNIAGNILITAKLVAGKWVADAEDYPNAGS